MLQQLLVNGIIAGGIYALVALGFSVIYRTVKFFHFAHGVVYTAGAYVAYKALRWWWYKNSAASSRIWHMLNDNV